MEFCQIQLNYLDWSFQECEGKGRAFDRVSHSCMGYGASARRTFVPSDG